MSKTKKSLLCIAAAAAALFLAAGAAFLSVPAAHAQDDYASVGDRYFHTDTAGATVESFLNKAPNLVDSYRGVLTEMTVPEGTENASMMFNATVKPSEKLIISYDWNEKSADDKIMPVADCVVTTFSAVADPSKQVSLVQVNRYNRTWITAALTDDLYFDGGYAYVGGTQSPVIGRRDTGSYDSNGYTAWNAGEYNWGAIYGGEFQLYLTSAGDLRVNDSTLIANLLDENWLNASKANLAGSKYEERYTADYVNSILAAFNEKNGALVTIDYYGLKDTRAAINIRQINGQWLTDNGNVPINVSAKTTGYVLPKTDTLYLNVAYKPSELFTRYSIYRDAEGTDISYNTGFRGTDVWAGAGGVWFDFGYNRTTQDAEFTLTEEGEYKIIINTADGAEFAGAGKYWSTDQVFTFNVRDGKPTVDLAENAAFVKGVEVDLTAFFAIWHLGDDLAVTYAADGAPLSGSAFTPTADSHEITVTATDLYGTAEETFTVSSVSIEVESRVSAKGYYGEPISLPLPVTPAGTQYTLCVYDENDEEVTRNIAHAFAEEGTYTVVYSFTVFGAMVPVTMECEFTVSLEERAPEIAVEGEYEATYYAGKRLTLLSATATSAAGSAAAEVEVYRGGEKVAVQDGAITLAEGEYEIVYFAVYGGDKRAEARRAFTVLADTEAPVIVVDGAYAAEYQAGNVIGILDAAVSDNSGETLTYSVEITRGNKPVEPENGEVKLKKGDYKIVYRATDLAGNAAEKVFEFKVTGQGCACNGEIGGEVWLAAFALPAAAMWLIIRRKKNESEK